MSPLFISQHWLMAFPVGFKHTGFKTRRSFVTFLVSSDHGGFAQDIEEN